jgi:hypothetical protein
VEGELEVHHGEGSRAANSHAYPDSYDYVSDAYPYSYAHPDSYPYPDSDAHPHPYSYSHPYSHPYSDAYAPGYCPLRSGAVVLHHPGAELFRD